jgi:hypothetical protein
VENWERLKWHEVEQYESQAVGEVYIITTEMKKLGGTSLLVVQKRYDTVPFFVSQHILKETCLVRFSVAPVYPKLLLSKISAEDMTN